jgi:hypothetical protein
MIVVTAAASIGVFLVALWLSGVVPASASALAIARSALGALRDTGLDDAAREQAVQRASIRLTVIFVSILVRGAVAIGASLLPIWLANAAGLAASDQVIDFLSRWDVIVIASIVIVLGYLLRIWLWASN